MTLLDPLRARLPTVFASPPREPETRFEREMHGVAVLACVFYACVAFWEAFGPLSSGHFSTSAAYAMGGENMVNWRKFAVFTSFVAKPVTPDQYYCHHPYGITVLEAIAYAIFGHHPFTARAGAILCAVMTPPLIYGFGRRAWGVVPGAIATVFFVLVPITLSFAQFSNLEEPTIAFGMLFAWATAALWDTWKTRYVVLAAIGALGACNGDWAGMVFIGPVGAFGFVRAYVLPRRWYGRIDEREFARWFAAVTAMAVGTLLLYLMLFAKADKLGDLMGSYHLRSSGSDEELAAQLSQRRRLWLGTMLTPVSYGAMAIGIPLAALRLPRKPLEIIPIAWFMAASFQYFVFKQGADIHIFWPHYYAPAAALAAGTLTATLLQLRGGMVALAKRWSRRVAVPRVIGRATGIGIAVVLGVPLFLLGRMGIAELVQARKTAGRFDQGGHHIETDGDMSQFAEWAVSNVATAGAVTQVLERYDYSFASEYAGNRPYTRVNALAPTKLEDPQRIALVDTRNQSVKDLETIAKQMGVQVVGPFWRVDRAQKGPALVALRYEPRQPKLLERLFITGTDLVHTFSREEDPFATWEWRDALNLPNPTPTATPVTDEELRIAHNIAVHDKDAARAEDLRAKLAGRVGFPVGVDYTGGVRLDGVKVEHGPAIVVTLFFHTEPSFKAVDANYQLKCKVTAPPWLWPAPLDYFDKDMAPVPPIRPADWKPGYLYAQRFVALHRIGKEECRGAFSSSFHPTGEEQNPLLVTFD
jgi:4-amino-4-deoxy-L-arabinose transferase-like glycosyltransferase